MTRRHFTLLALLLTVALGARLDAAELHGSDAEAPTAEASTTTPPSSKPASELTPAQRAIDVAERRIAASPDDARGYVDKAMALARRARETADMDLYAEGETFVAKAFELSPASLDAARAEAWLLLGQHRFAAALEKAEEVHRRFPDDLLTYALIADAAVELGDYDRAEEATQWMLDLRPGAVTGLTRGAYLRELFGDLPGAYDWMREAYGRIRPTETEDRAWVLVHMAHLERLRGRLDEGSKLAQRALDLFPDYHYALAQLAKIREAQGRYDDAIELWERHYAVADHPENLYYLAKAKYSAGAQVEARDMMREFEIAALEESKNEDNANRDLVLYYVDYAGEPEKALDIAEREVKRRRDVLTLDAYAWALEANGRSAEARAALSAALEVGVLDPELLSHAEALGLDVSGRSL